MPHKFSLNGFFLSALGFFLPLTLVNGVTFGGVYLPVIYVVAMMGCGGRLLLNRELSVNASVFVFAVLFSFFSALYFWGVDYIAGIKVLLGFMLFSFLYASADYEEKFYGAFRTAIVFCFCVCLVQFCLFVAGGEALFYEFRIPVTWWNDAGWYFMKNRDALPAFPGLSYEPAYMSIFFSFSFLLAYFKCDRLLMMVSILGLFLTFSRNGMLFLMFFLFVRFFVFFSRSRLLLFGALSLFVCAMPLLIFLYVDWVGFDALDVSVYSRIIPFYIFKDLDFLTMLIGSGSYQMASLDSHYYQEFFSLFLGSREDPFVDPRSFLGGILWQAGFVGLLLFMWLVYKLSCSVSVLAYLFVIPFFGAALNAYFIDWPIFWVFLFYFSRFDRFFARRAKAACYS